MFLIFRLPARSQAMGADSGHAGPGVLKVTLAMQGGHPPATPRSRCGDGSRKRDRAEKTSPRTRLRSRLATTPMLRAQTSTAHARANHTRLLRLHARASCRSHTSACWQLGLPSRCPFTKATFRLTVREMEALIALPLQRIWRPRVRPKPSGVRAGIGRRD